LELFNELPLDVSAIDSSVLNATSSGYFDLFERENNPANADISMQLTCANEHMRGSISVLFKNRRWEEVEHDRPVSGWCDDLGNGAFSVKIPIRRFDDQKFTEMLFNFKLTSGNGFLSMVAFDENMKQVGAARLWVN